MDTDVDLRTLLAVAPGADEAARVHLADRLRGHPGLGGLSGTDAYVAADLLRSSGALADLPEAARLARVAHDDGVAGAGHLHANLVDQVSLYSGRPQPYGTVLVEHEGDVVQPPVDPSVDDDARRVLGVPSLAELRAEAERSSRELARERAATPGLLPRSQRFCRVWTDPDPADLRARRDAEGSSAWADGDVLTFVVDSAVPVVASPTFPLPSWEVEPGLHALQVRVERLEEAVVTYTFVPLGGVPRAGTRGAHDGRFRGPSAPPEQRSNDPLRGTLTDHLVASEPFGDRAVSVYRPAGHRPGDGTPVVYATDGNLLGPYARRLDAAIEDGHCPPVVLVGAHAAPSDHVHGNQRALEYLVGFDPARFAAHERFFTDELVAWAESTFGVPAERARRAVFGCSDGGGHALTVARRHGDRFAHVIACSTGMPPEAQFRWDVDGAPFVHLCAGTLEGGFHQATEAWAAFLHLVGARHHFTERVAGHDLVQWAEELPAALRRAWV
ncbi:MAG: esterase family protein [Actinobacteria bacterium]|nr:esterase family protein [Actinomycetota bacterium]